MNKPKIIAFYLPQFHPIPENDEWWGKGFTEWNNVVRAKKYFLGHYQPKLPGELGFYDIRIPEVREQQADLAKEYGVFGFCYWHYWFGNGKELLNRPFDEVIQSGKPDFPFCLAWANESWFKKQWTKSAEDKLLIEQLYSGEKDYVNHFYKVLPAFKDKRYIKVDNKPLFVIYKPNHSSELQKFMKTWKYLAIKEGFSGIHFVAHTIDEFNSVDKYFEEGYEAVNTTRKSIPKSKRYFIEKVVDKINHIFKLFPVIKNYARASKYFFIPEIDAKENVYPSILCGWDHTPRSGKNGVVLSNYTPNTFYMHAKKVLKNTKSEFVFLKSWNEWGEGNFIEPDAKYGREFLIKLKEASMMASTLDR
jgi:hypothetical protein